MSDRPDPIAECLRRATPTIEKEWQDVVRAELPELARLDRAALIDHLPELLFGLAAWIEGDKEAGLRGFDALARGHALTRLGHNVSLETLFTEYKLLRGVILRNVLALDALDSVRDARTSLMLLHDGLDHAVHAAVRRYSTNRERTREQFVSILGHDLRNPMQAITLGIVQIANTACNEPKHQRLAAIAQRSADRMLRMIADVIDLAHAQLGGGIPTVPRHCNLGEICEEAAQELRLAHPDRTIEVQIRGDVEGTFDRDRLMQVVSNLLGNAIQHGHEPFVVSAIEHESKTAITLRVENHGPPIPEELLPHLFDPFRSGTTGDRAHRKARPRGNLGLGLYIVHQIVLAHGGTIDVTSAPDRTAFDIWLPRIPSVLTPDRP